MDTSKIITEASSLLQKKTLGGISKESAIEAIQKAVEKAKTAAEEAVGKVQQELRTYQNKSANDIAKITSEKDAFKKESEKAIADAKAECASKLKEAKKVKIHEKTLPNGNTEIRKVNKNGAVMVKEVTPEGKLVKVEVTSAEGDYVKTTYNANTGKPLKTFKTTNGDKTIKYNAEGKSVETKNVNVKKVKPQKPELQATEILKEDSSFAEIKKTYSDGSYEMISYSKMQKAPIKQQIFNSEGKLVKNIDSDFRGNTPIHTTNEFDPVTSIIKKRTCDYEQAIKTEYFTKQTGSYPQNALTKVELLDKNTGIKQIIKANIDEYGFIDSRNPNIDYIYPKKSKIKSSRVEFKSPYYPQKETIKMKDGSTVVLSTIDGNYNIYTMEIIPKGQIGEVINDSAKITEWCQNNGRPLYDRGNRGIGEQYYNNNL